jgi:hypothetical protein
VKLGMLKATVINKKVSPPVPIQVWHAGMNDYRVYLPGIGEYAQCSQRSPAMHKAIRLSEFGQEAMAWEIAKITQSIV